MNIGYFVSSHGYGHAARACAVMEKMWELKPGKFFIFTSVPDWFFHNSLMFSFEYINIQTDVGLVQSTPFDEDIEKTIVALNDFLPFTNNCESLIQSVSQMKLDLILSDISPLGLWIAKQLGIPAILIENFTWDWIYEIYLDEHPVLNEFISLYREFYKLPDLHFSCEPYCYFSARSIVVPPVFRDPKSNRETIRYQLGVNDSERLILVTMGGIPIDQLRVDKSPFPKNYKFLIPVNQIQYIHANDNIIYLPHNHQYFHPDLVNAADLVIGKLGYSTVAEVYSNSKPFLFIGRKSFRESKVLEKFVLAKIISQEVAQESFFSKTSVELIEELISKHKDMNRPLNGANLIADIVYQIIN